jgi:AraC family transcriptional regulator
MHSEKLSNGHYYGQVVKRGELTGLILTETLYPPRAVVPSHSHNSAYFCVVLDGAYSEAYEHHSRECRAMTLAFHPPEETHSERFHNQTVRSFNVEIEPWYMRRVRQYCSILDTPAAFQGGSMAWLGIRLYSEFKVGDNVSPLAMEGLALEIIATGSRSWTHTASGGQSPWMRKAMELLEARFTESLTIGEIAAAVDVHPVHLAREFRKHHQCTIGDFIRRMRVEFACEQIQKHDRPLSEISAMAGFFDQSHFSRTFKALTGMTPGEFRTACH